MEVLPQDALWGCQIRLAFAGRLNNALAAPAGHDQGPVGTVAPVALGPLWPLWALGWPDIPRSLSRHQT